MVDAIDRQDAVLVAAIEVPDDLVTEKIDLVVPALALRRFDHFAGRRGMTRSAFFLEAANRWIVQEGAAGGKTEVLVGPASEAAGHPIGYDIEAIRRELGGQDHRDLPNDFATSDLSVPEDLPAPEDHADEVKAEMMRLLEGRSAPTTLPPERGQPPGGAQPPGTGDRKRD